MSNQGQKQLDSGRQSATRSDVRRLFPQLDDGKCVAILRTGASLADLEEVAVWLAGEDDVMGEIERPLHDTAAQVYDIITADEWLDEER